MRAEAFIIHLARAEKRRPQVDRLIGSLPLTAHVVDGVDGLKLSPEDIGSVYQRRIVRPYYPFDLRNTEIGCFLSHRRAWQQIVDSGLDAGLVVEDDVAIDEAVFEKMLALSLQEGTPRDYIRFPFRDHTDRGPAVASGPAGRLVRPKRVGLGMQVQLVGREAAATLLENTRRFDRPVDTTLQLDAVTGVRILAAQPVCIRTVHEALGGTVVQRRNKSLPETVSREIKRAMYRLTISLKAWTGRRAN